MIHEVYVLKKYVIKIKSYDIYYYQYIQGISLILIIFEFN